MTTAGEQSNGGGSLCVSVMVFERDALVREALCELLRGWDFEVIAASGPDDATRVTLHTMPDFAIVNAPDGDAVAGAAWVAAVHARYGRLPIIFVADQPFGIATPERCVPIAWPIHANRLREALDDLIS